MLTRAAGQPPRVVMRRASNRRWTLVVGLVHAEATPARQRDFNQTPPRLLVNRRARHLILRHPGHERVKIVTQEKELVLAVGIGGVQGNFSWRQSEDEPAAAAVHVGQLQHVTEEHAIGLWIDAIDNRVCTDDHARTSYVAAASRRRTIEFSRRER